MSSFTPLEVTDRNRYFDDIVHGLQTDLAFDPTVQARLGTDVVAMHLRYLDKLELANVTDGRASMSKAALDAGKIAVAIVHQGQRITISEEILSKVDDDMMQRVTESAEYVDVIQDAVLSTFGLGLPQIMEETSASQANGDGYSLTLSDEGSIARVASQVNIIQFPDPFRNKILQTQFRPYMLLQHLPQCNEIERKSVVLHEDRHIAQTYASPQLFVNKLDLFSHEDEQRAIRELEAYRDQAEYLVAMGETTGWLPEQTIAIDQVRRFYATAKDGSDYAPHNVLLKRLKELDLLHALGDIEPTRQHDRPTLLRNLAMIGRSFFQIRALQDQAPTANMQKIEKAKLPKALIGIPEK